MNIDTAEFRALTEQVAELTTRVSQLEYNAFKVRTLEEMLIREAYGYSPIPGSAQIPRVRRVILEEVAKADESGQEHGHLRVIRNT